MLNIARIANAVRVIFFHCLVSVCQISLKGLSKSIIVHLYLMVAKMEKS